MLKKIRIFLAIIFFVSITFLFLDFTGSAHALLGWTTKVQFLPALLAGNFLIVLGLTLLTLVFGRVYCSVICPLGILQDFVLKFSEKNRAVKLGYKKAHTKLRIFFLILFIFLGLSLSTFSIATIIAPYSAYGRIVSNLFSPIYISINNLFAFIAEKLDSYAFYNVEIVFKGFVSFGIALGSFILVYALAWKYGRVYCNSVCPVGTVLGFLAKFSIFKPVINLEKCNSCGLCARKCKASCINSKEHKIDYSRCVACFDCLSNCKQGAISYSFRRNKSENKIHIENSQTPNQRRGFLASIIFLASPAITDKPKIKVDGGLEPLKPRKKPVRNFRILPAGAKSNDNFSTKCTGCQLCVSVCPTKVIEPSRSLEHLLQPEMSFVNGYCDINCKKCSEVCPSGAILPISLEEKTSIQIGVAKFTLKDCVNITDKLQCDNCFRQCPTGTIQMVKIDPKNPKSLSIPAIDENRCIGCGACENLCPARPISAIYVDGVTIHRSI